MKIKEKIIGIILIALGALPFILKIESVSTAFLNNKILSYFVPGGIVYQLIIIILGIALVWTIKPRFEAR